MTENTSVKALKPSDFEMVQKDAHILDENFQGKPIGFFKDAMIRFVKNKGAIIAAMIIMLLVALAIVGPSLNDYGYKEQHLHEGWTLLPPRVPGLEKLGIFDGSKEIDVQKATMEQKYGDAIIKVVKEYDQIYRNKKIPMATIKVDMYKLNGAEDSYFWFGTDALGRDQWTRLWRGSRISLTIAILAVFINVFIGVVYGSISGYYGGWVDMLMQRFIEIISSIPTMVVVILAMMFLGDGLMSFVIAFVFTGWTGMSRMIRAQFYKYKGHEYVLASRTMGAKDKTLIFRHILPNAIGPIITQATLAIPSAIFLESTLSYLGLGIAAPEPSIGNLLSEGQKVLLTTPHLVVFPAILISILMLSFNMFGNGLRDAFDPTLRGQ